MDMSKHGWWKEKVEHVDVIVWHQHPDTNYRTHVDFKRPLLVRQYDPTKPLPDRGSAYAYQIGKGIKITNKYGHTEVKVEVTTLGGMVYFGEPVETDGILYCRDQRGHLWPLEQGVDSIEPVVKGEITITHSGEPSNGWES